MRIVLALVFLFTVGACSSEEAPRAAPTRAPSSAPDSTAPRPETSHTKACAEVRAGIDAFNLGDFEGTVGHFETALPLARTDARTHPSSAADDLVEAIRYYAELAPEDYPESARSSPEFLEYKGITLGQCVSEDRPLQGATRSPGVTA